MLVVCPQCRRCDQIVLGPQSSACKQCHCAWQEPYDCDRRHQILGYNPDRLRALGFRWARQEAPLLDRDPFLPETSDWAEDGPNELALRAERPHPTFLR